MAVPKLPPRFRFTPLYAIIVIGGLLIGGLYFKEIVKYFRDVTPAETACHLDSTYYYTANTASATKAVFAKTVYTYLANGKLESALKQTQISPPGNAGQNHEKFSYTYNAAGTEVHLQWQTWNTASNTWTNYINVDTTYVNGKIADYTVQNWEAITGTWINTVKNIYTYNASGQLEQQVTQVWATTPSPGWLNSTSKEFTYTNDGVIKLDSSRGWSITSWSIAGSWTAYTYDAGGQLIQKTEQQLGGSPTMWQNYSNTIYTYNSGGQLIQDVFQLATPPNPAFKNYRKHEYTYVGNNCLQSEKLYLAEMDDGNAWETRYVETENFYINLP